jgi:hypothetical protein
MAASSFLLSLTSFAIAALFALVDVTFLVMVLTTVRRQRPDAWVPLAAAIGVALLTSALGLVSNVVASALVAPSGGMETFIRYNIASHVFLAMTGLGARVLFIVGVLRLARDPFAAPMQGPPGPRL